MNHKAPGFPGALLRHIYHHYLKSSNYDIVTGVAHARQKEKYH